nr:hypothetical protein [Tanacetum cinerariifolium]
MADVNVNAPAEQALAMAPPTRTNDQILSRSRWVPVEKSNCYLDVEKSQSNLIYKIAVVILKHTNFFRAFTTSLTIPSIYIQQFWDTTRYDRDTARYICQLDEQCDAYVQPSLATQVCSSLRSLKPKRTIESRAKRSSKIISLGHCSIMLASSHTVKSKSDIKSPTHYPHGIARTSE